jgi:hypothetical protein
MRAPHFSIGSLLTVIAILGVGLAALRNPSPLWASALYTVAATAIVAGAANAIVGHGARRAYWLGFSLFGGAYIYFTGSSQLVTDTFLDLAYPYVAAEVPSAAPASPNGPNPSTSVTLGSPVQASYAPTTVPGTVTIPPAPAIPAFSAPNATPSPAVSAWDHWLKPDLQLDEFIPPRELSAKFSSLTFRQIGHALAALLAATLGGVFVQWRCEESSREKRPVEVSQRT